MYVSRTSSSSTNEPARSRNSTAYEKGRHTRRDSDRRRRGEGGRVRSGLGSTTRRRLQIALLLLVDILRRKREGDVTGTESREERTPTSLVEPKWSMYMTA